MVWNKIFIIRVGHYASKDKELPVTKDFLEFFRGEENVWKDNALFLFCKTNEKHIASVLYFDFGQGYLLDYTVFGFLLDC